MADVGESYQSGLQYSSTDDDTTETSGSSGSSGEEIPNRTKVRFRYYNEESDSREGTLILTFPQPNISVDQSTRTVKHDIIGDKTVVQKIGESATEVSVEGICTNEEALIIDTLSDYDYVNMDSHRWGSNYSQNSSSISSDENGYAIVTSTSTSPIADGGGVTAPDGEYHWSHEFTIELTSIENPNN